MGFFWQDASGLVNMLVKVIPGAKKTWVKGICDVAGHYPVKKALRVYLAAPPVDGKANAELIGFLSCLLNIRSACINIESGDKGRLKLIKFGGSSDVPAILDKLGNICAE